MKRFVDFDVRLDSGKIGPVAYLQQLKASKQNAHDFLRAAYPGIENLRSRFGDEQWGHWYTELRAVRIAGTGDEFAEFDLKDLTFSGAGGYWDLKSAVKIPLESTPAALIADLTGIAEKFVNLNTTKQVCPDFDAFPVQWPDRFKYCEVNQIVRLSTFDPELRQMSVSRSNYLESCVLNLRCDEPLPSLNEGTTRQLARHNGRLAPLKESPLANGIGVACLFITKGNILVFNDRKGREEEGKPMAVMKAGVHISSSGVLEWADICRADNSVDAESFASGLIRGMVREIDRECGIPPEGVDGVRYDIAALAFARELPRAGKPQFFFLARFDCNAEALKSLLIKQRNAPGKAPEGHEYGTKFLPRRLSPHGAAPKLGPQDVLDMTYEAVGAIDALASVDIRHLQWRPAADFSMRSSQAHQDAS